MVPLARKEARSALELLPSERMAHALLGAIAGLDDYDWKEAEERFRLTRARELGPFVDPFRAQQRYVLHRRGRDSFTG